MSEPSTNVPGDVADAQVDDAQIDETTDTSPDADDKVELDVDDEKLEAWDAVKSDYQVDPDAEDMPPGQDDEGMEGAVAPG